MGLAFEVTRTMAFTTLVLAQLVHAINVRSAGDELSAPQASLVGAILVSFLMQVAVVYLPVGNSVFDTAALGPTEWLLDPDTERCFLRLDRAAQPSHRAPRLYLAVSHSASVTVRQRQPGNRRPAWRR
jgi:hypothetical protein